MIGYLCKALKRLVVIPLLMIYLIAVSGVMIELHYCGQELESWQLFTKNDGCEDDACGDESSENDGCCKDELVVAKVNQEQEVASQLVLKLLNSSYDATLPEFVIVLQGESKEAASQLIHSANAPPGLWQNIPLYKLHSNFTYYG